MKRGYILYMAVDEKFEEGELVGVLIDIEGFGVNSSVIEKISITFKKEIATILSSASLKEDKPSWFYFMMASKIPNDWYYLMFMGPKHIGEKSLIHKKNIFKLED